MGEKEYTILYVYPSNSQVRPNKIFKMLIGQGWAHGTWGVSQWGPDVLEAEPRVSPKRR
jgi:hypothetical protein